MLVLLIAGFMAVAAPSPLEMARDQQDRGALEKMVNDYSAAAAKAPNDAGAQYMAALASSYLAEVALEVRDRKQAEQVAERLNCSKATVRSHIANARVKLRKHFARLDLRPCNSRWSLWPPRTTMNPR